MISVVVEHKESHSKVRTMDIAEDPAEKDAKRSLEFRSNSFFYEFELVI